MWNQNFNKNNNNNINMNQMNPMYQAHLMMQMNKMMNTNFNVNLQNQMLQFNNMINSNPMFLMLYNQMMMNMMNMQKQNLSNQQVNVIFLNNTLNGKKMGYDWTGNLQDGAVEIYDASDIAAKGTQDAINKAIEDLKEKKLKVFDTSKFTVNGKPVTSYKIEGDKELISDGYFHESEYTSA